MSSVKAQQGLALIVVMVILLVVTILGISAVRMSLTSLSVATNSQIKGLLFQSADAGHLILEEQSGIDLKAAFNEGGLLDVGSDTISPGALGGDKRWCLLKGQARDKALVQQVCNPTTDFMSFRDAVVTQLWVRKMGESVAATSDAGLGSDSEVSVNFPIQVQSTSILVTYNGASLVVIQDCLKLDAEPAAKCLNDKGVESVTNVQDYTAGYTADE